jgi:hypothetical protein
MLCVAREGRGVCAPVLWCVQQGGGVCVLCQRLTSSILTPIFHKKSSKLITTSFHLQVKNINKKFLATIGPELNKGIT